MTRDLDSFIKDNKRFLKIQDGQSVRVIYRGYKVGTNQEGNEIVHYQVQDPMGGAVMSWGSASIMVAEKMSKISIGEELTITRKGEGRQTGYKIDNHIGEVEDQEAGTAQE